jgi:hypothetical protein
VGKVDGSRLAGWSAERVEVSNLETEARCTKINADGVTHLQFSYTAGF